MEDSSIGLIVFVTVFALSLVDVSGFQLDNLQEGNVRLVGGTTGVEGRAEIYHNGEWVSICFSAGGDHKWEFPEGDVFCRQLGYASGSALILNGQQTTNKYGAGGSSTLLTNVDCASSTDPKSLLDCASVEWGSSCGNDFGLVGVVCRIPGYVGCYQYDQPGFLLNHKITSGDMTIDKCIEACIKSPGPFRYAGLRKEDCNCGDVTLPTVKDDDHQCYETCPGDNTQTCGAFERTAIYDLIALRNGHYEPHILWPVWGREYNTGDNGKIWRVNIPAGYDYAILYILTFQLADADSIILRSETRQYGTTLLGVLDLELKYRWITHTAKWFEVETEVTSTTPGGRGFTIYYKFGKHCSATDLAANEVEGGEWRSGGVYYEYECPMPDCDEGYKPESSAVCLLNGTWTGTGSCLMLPTTRRPLFPIDDPTATAPPASPETTIPTTQSPPPPPSPTTPPPPPPQTTGPSTPGPQTTDGPTPPPPSTEAPTAPPTIRTEEPLPPVAQCYLPSINAETGTLLGTDNRAVFNEMNIITHCCTHKSSDCVDLTCLSNRQWSNAAYLERCPAAVCLLPDTDENGSIGNTNGKAYFKNGDEISLCCIHSDYCFILKCQTDGNWANGDQLLSCPGPRPDGTDSTLPVWIIVVVIVAGVLALIFIVALLVACCCFNRPQVKDKRLLKSRDPPPYFIQPRDRSPSPARRHHSPSRKDPVVIGLPLDPPKYIQDYSQYGGKPIIIGGHHHDRDLDHHHHHPSQHHNHDERDRRSRRDERADPRDPRDQRDRRHQNSGRPPKRREEDVASALGALNTVVRDFDRASSSVSNGS